MRSVEASHGQVSNKPKLDRSLDQKTATDSFGSVATGRVEGQQTFGLLPRQLAADALA
jgi:hypothetical protein